MYYNQKGYALPMVMVVSMIIVLITVSIVFSVRQRMATALDLKDRSAAYLRGYSAISQVLYNILTATFTPTGLVVQQEDGKVVQWNLHGKPIELAEGVWLSLRDIAGMVSPLFQPEHFKKLVEHTSQDSTATSGIMDTLRDWQDDNNLKRLNGAESRDYKIAGYPYGPRNFHLQLAEEVMLLKGFDQELFQGIRDDIVYWNTGSISYLTMSEETLRALLRNDSLVDRIVELREKGELTGRIFRDLTGIQFSEETIYGPSGWIKVEIKVQVGKANHRINAIVVKHELRRPFMVLEWKS